MEFKKYKEKYVCIVQTDYIIDCFHITDNYYEAVGRIHAELETNKKELIEDNGYELVSYDYAYKLEADTGFGWSIHLRHTTDSGKIIDHKDCYYLLIYEGEEK